MKRIAHLAAALAIASASAGAALVALAGPAAASLCTAVNTSKGSMTAAVYDTTPAPGTTVDATGCQIGVYYDGGYTGGGFSDVTVENATYYGVFVDGISSGNLTVDLTDNTITDIGENPFNGAQHGNAIYYYGYDTAGTVSGTVSGNTVSQYQKGGIIVNGSQASVTVSDNTVTGLGPVAFIAQNGVQFGYGATGDVRGNTISDNYYTGCSNQDAAKTGCTPWVSTGLLLYDVDPQSVSRSNNHFSGDQRNLYVIPSASL